jgi:hypothetical protein
LSDLPVPLTPADCDLRDFPHTPLFRSRLFGSSFHARATDSEWRAGVTLWLKSWDQVPAGSLPNDDIELCRLGELARDLKTWKKVKPGALRGWVLCSDGRLYHPVVAEGVNNAIEKKAAQRLKTAKARIAALEKRLKEAATDAERLHITEEIAKVKQTLSQTVGVSVTDPVSESKGRRREGEGEGNSDSAPIGAGGAAAGLKPKTPEQLRKSELWRAIKTLLVEQQEAKDLKAAGAIVTQAINRYDEPTALAAIEATLQKRPAGIVAYLEAACQQATGLRPNKQEALEAGNLAAAERFASEEDHAAS